MLVKQMTNTYKKYDAAITRSIAVIVMLIIMSSTLVFAYGALPSSLEHWFAFDLVALLAKSLLAIAMIQIAVFSRPRSLSTNFILGALCTAVTGLTALSAFQYTLLLADAVVLTLGVLIASREATHAVSHYSSSKRFSPTP